MNDSLFDNIFIWTEAFNCGEILDPMLGSYLAHNNAYINIFGTPEDFQKISHESPLLKLHNLDDKITKKILANYKNGHWGTAELWTYILTNRPEKYFLHLDSDTIFLANITTELAEAVKLKGFSLVGPRRPYFHRPYRKSGFDGKSLDKLPDVVGTDCFIFNKEFISLRPYWNLKRKIFGKRPFKHPVIDFFDPISFEMINKGCTVLYIDSPENGFQGLSNPKSDFHNKMISFGAVGSGSNFYKNPNVKTSPGYKSFALSSYSLYCKWLLNKDIGIVPLDAPEIVLKLERINQKSWKLE